MLRSGQPAVLQRSFRNGQKWHHRPSFTRLDALILQHTRHPQWLEPTVCEWRATEQELAATLRCQNLLLGNCGLTSGTCRKVAMEGASQKWFSGECDGGAAAYKVSKRRSQVAFVTKEWRGMSLHTLGPWLTHDAGRQAALALEALDIKDLTVDGGDGVDFRKLDEKFPDKLAADRMGEAMEEAFGLKFVQAETTEAFKRRAR